jgi:ubiquinone/menaquinone biosynthesis C-methylase UbiE
MFTSDSAYDKFMGRFSVRLAPVFADFAGIERGTRVLDVGAGTGALTAELVRRETTAAAAEPAPAFVASLHARFPDLDVREAPAESLPWADESFDAALAQLVVSFMRDAPTGVAEMRRVVSPGGIVAVCMWDRDGMELLDVINRVQAAVTPERSADISPYRDRDALQGLLGSGAETELLSVESSYDGFDDFWDAWAAGVGPAGVWLDSLTDAQREAARENAYRELGEPNGAFTLVGRAWAAKVRRP